MSRTEGVDGREPGRQPVRVRVCFFGLIAIMTGERSLELELPADATLRDLLALLSERYGESFKDNVMRTADERASHCRISLNGRLVRGMDPRLATDGTATVEIVLLSAQEGG